MNKYVCGIDNGGTAVKCALFDLDGNEIAVASAPTPLVIPSPGFEERDMDVLWRSNADVIRRCLEKAGISGNEVIGIGCTGHGKGLYLTEENGKPLRNAIASTDSRAVGYIKKWAMDGTLDEMAKLTLHNPIACQPITLLAWLKDNEPDNYAKVGWIFEAKDYIRFRLTGKALAEMTDYSGSGMMNLRTQKFDRRIFELAGVEEMFGCLPELCNSSDNCGFVTPDIAEETGLAEGTPVSGGMFDIDACAIAAGVTDGSDICMVTGTWSINEYISDAPVICGTNKNSMYCIPGKYLIEESSATSAGNLEWFVSIMMGKEAEEAKNGGRPVYAVMDDMVASTQPEDSVAVFVPFLYGTNSEARSHAVIDGLDLSVSRAQLLRAVFEGVAFSHYDHYLRLIGNRQAPSAIRMVGGAARSAVWSQMFADVTGCPVRTVSAKEPGAFGAAMSAAVASGYYSDYVEAAGKMVKFRKEISPDLKLHDKYLAKFEKYKAVAEV
ncbi:MAG: carbohydrate kinase [Clostridia bacterium]|nr:carbohydrate kinase [Clostridia bacterium]